MEDQLSLSDMKKKKTISSEEAIKLTEQAKREEKLKISNEKTKKEQDEVLGLVDKRIEELAKENEEFNNAKQEAMKVKEKELENIPSDSEYDDLDIPDDYKNNEDLEIVGDDIMDNKDEELVLYTEEPKEKTTKVDLNSEFPKSSIDLEEEKQEENSTLEIVYDDEKTIEDITDQHSVLEENKEESKVKIIDRKNDHTIMKSGALLSEKDNRRDTIFDDNDFKEITKSSEDSDNKDYIDIPDEESRIEEDNKEEKDLILSQEELDKAFDDMKGNLSKLLHPIKNVIDMSTFKVGSPINVNNAKSTRHKDVIEHVLWNSKRTFSFEELEGFEVNELAAPLEKDVSEYTQTLRKFTILYDHIRSKKPSDATTWLKSLRDDDLDHVYGGAYIGSFKYSNILASQCEKCQFPYISADIPIMNMMKFETDKVKQEYSDLLNNPDDSPYVINGKGYQISDDYILKIKSPSVWKTRMEPLLLEPEFRAKYGSIINILTYVDTIYYIDREKGEYRPIDFTSEFKNNEPNRLRKVLKNKIKKYGTIITKELSSNEFQKMWNCIYKEIKTNDNRLSYILPERTCPKCNHVDKEYNMTAEDLLFTRHQLAQLASI